MKPLVDSDLVLYELGFASQTKDEEGNIVPKDWEFVQDLLEKRLKLICEEVGATEPPLLFLTNTPRINKMLNKERKRQDVAPVAYVESFRTQIAAAISSDHVDSKGNKG